MDDVRMPNSGTVRMPKILVTHDAVLLLLGPGIGDRANGLDVAASSLRLKQSNSVVTVNDVPPDIPELGMLAVYSETVSDLIGVSLNLWSWL
jgi:hypothetical protein